MNDDIAGGPERVVIAGDWHGNWPWAAAQLLLMRDQVPSGTPLIVLHAGDFGWWPGSLFPDSVAALALDLGIRVWVTPGNHENYPGITAGGWLSGDPASDDRPLLALARGTRWEWHGLRWLSAGGATSPDRATRVKGTNWWPEEELTDAEVTAIAKGGPADALITHDAGSAVPLPLGEWPRYWPDSEYRRARAHRKRVQRLADAVRPRLWVHGHYHLFRNQGLMMPWACTVTSLDMDGARGNWGVLNARTLGWEGFNDS